MFDMIKIRRGGYPSRFITACMLWCIRWARILGTSFVLCLPVGAVQAAEMPELARKNECVNCHAIDERVVGPAWMDVSKKYKGDPKAEEKLLVRVSKGSSGFFGLIHMPANDPDGTKQAEMKWLIKFILGLEKSNNPDISPASK